MVVGVRGGGMTEDDLYDGAVDDVDFNSDDCTDEVLIIGVILGEVFGVVLFDIDDITDGGCFDGVGVGVGVVDRDFDDSDTLDDDFGVEGDVICVVVVSVVSSLPPPPIV